jgi:hypothetical protein
LSLVRSEKVPHHFGPPAHINHETYRTPACWLTVPRNRLTRILRQLNPPGLWGSGPDVRRREAPAVVRVRLVDYWLKGTFSQLRTSRPSLLLPATVNRT